jgi:predicted PurR-regulated permease PerM
VHFRQWLGLIVLALSLYVLWEIRQVVLVVFAAVVLATILNRVVRQMEQFRIKRGIAIAITITILITLIAGFFALIVPRFIVQLQVLSDILPQASQRLGEWSDWLQTVIPTPVIERFQGFENFSQQLQTWITRLLSNFFVFINNSLVAVINLLLFLVLTIMLLVDPSPYRRIFILGFPAFYRRRVDGILSQCEHSLVGWIKGTLLAMCAIAIVSFIGLSILGVPLPLVNAALAGLLEFIPNVGPTLSLVPPVLLALLESPWKAIAVIVLYLAIQQLESLVLVPLIMKQEVDLLPVFTILAVVVFASLFGFLGLFLAIPLLIVLQVWVKEVLVKDILNQWYPDKKEKARLAESSERQD